MDPRFVRRDRIAAAVLVVAAVLIAGLHWYGARHGIPFARFARDPLAVAKAPAHYGLLSNLGVLAWTAGATGALLARAALQPGLEERRFLLWAGLGTAYLALDDLYMLHESVYPEELGLLERWVLPAYLLGAAAFAWRFRRTLLEAWRLPLVLAAGFFAASLAVDKLDEGLLGGLHHLFEDGLKILGVLSWTAFLAHRAHAAIRSPADEG